ncbi:hypothetical protein HYT26_04405 [Candidatus Pacearchaeota archaeon]|nr:hypothetical protein [Candidatus Pacearchaeota archaeon]
MILENFSYGALREIKESPHKMHWSQSLLEQVTESKVLSQGEEFVLVKTDFLAPKLIKDATWRTDGIGETSKNIFERCNNIKTFKDIVRWFYQITLPESYINGEFPHEDYTLHIRSLENNAFVNLRIFPEGSYLLDLIDAEVEVYGDYFNVIARGATSSYSGGAEENDSKKPEQRTKTLNQLTKQNRIRQGKICIQAKDKEYEMGFKEFKKLSKAHSSDVGTCVIDRVKKADLSECALKEVLTYFKSLLDGCGVGYRW